MYEPASMPDGLIYCVNCGVWQPAGPYHRAAGAELPPLTSRSCWAVWNTQVLSRKSRLGDGLYLVLLDIHTGDRSFILGIIYLTIKDQQFAEKYG